MIEFLEVVNENKVGPDIRPDTGYQNYQAGYPVFSLTLMKLSGRISDNLVFLSSPTLNEN